MDNSTYNSIINLIKVFKKRLLLFPENGKQNFHDLLDSDTKTKEFELLINRKGHVRENVLTYQMRSKENGLLIRLDMTGPSHDDRNGNPIDTPHVHIFNDDHNNGRWAVSLSDFSTTPIINELNDSLILFLLYNKVDLRNVGIPLI